MGVPVLGALWSLEGELCGFLGGGGGWVELRFECDK